MTKRSITWHHTTAPRNGTLSARVGACELMVTPSNDSARPYRWELRRRGSTERIGFHRNQTQAKTAVTKAARNCAPNLSYHRKTRKKRGRR